MKYPKKSRLVALAAMAAFAIAPALAQTAPAGEGEAAYGVKIGKFFSEQQKEAARRAFAQKYAKAKECLPGMQKKTPKGECDSPWDTRYWAVGQSLQPAVTVYPVPEPVASKLPPAPKGYEYVRAADDILLISTGNKLVVDMIENLSG
ncbi:MAG TPA: RcnB family protein [Ramlibacter sp.]|nr:RcnB family protein [Ramlibacter sp.]